MIIDGYVLTNAVGRSAIISCNNTCHKKCPEIYFVDGFFACMLFGCYLPYDHDFFIPKEFWKPVRDKQCQKLFDPFKEGIRKVEFLKENPKCPKILLEREIMEYVVLQLSLREMVALMKECMGNRWPLPTYNPDQPKTLKKNK